MDPDLIPVAWAQACEARKLIEKIEFWSTWYPCSLTRRERRLVKDLEYDLELARESVMKLQASLADRSHAAGYEHPDYDTFRENNAK